MCAFAEQEQEAMLRLIHKKIVQGEGNALGNGAGSSPEYSSIAMASQHETAVRHTAECSAGHHGYSFLPHLFNAQVCFVHVLVDVSLKF